MIFLAYCIIIYCNFFFDQLQINLTYIHTYILFDRHSPAQVKTNCENFLARCLVRMFAFQLRLKDIDSSQWPGLDTLLIPESGSS